MPSNDVAASARRQEADTAPTMCRVVSALATETFAWFTDILSALGVSIEKIGFGPEDERRQST